MRPDGSKLCHDEIQHGQDEAKMEQNATKMEPRWAMMEPKWADGGKTGQDVSRWGAAEAKMKPR